MSDRRSPHFALASTAARAPRAAASLAVAEAPLGLDAAVDADEDLERFGAVPPAKPRAGDDPGVLVEPVTLVGGGWAAAGSQPGLKAPGAGRQGDLVERLLRRAWHVEGGRPRPPQSSAFGRRSEGRSRLFAFRRDRVAGLP